MSTDRGNYERTSRENRDFDRSQRDYDRSDSRSRSFRRSSPDRSSYNRHERSRSVERHRGDRDRSSSYRDRGHDRDRDRFSPGWGSVGRDYRRSRSPGGGYYDDYSGITDLENIRDRGRSGSPDRYWGDRDRGHHGRSRMDMDPPKILDCLRLVTALENLLGSLGPQITALMSRALGLDKKREGSSNILLEDANAAAILELTKEKLAGQVVAGKYTPFVHIVPEVTIA